MNKSILIIGGAGYIGSHVALEFQRQGWEITILDDLSSGCEENLRPDYRFIHDSFLNRPLLKGLLQEGFDGVIHLAAKKAAGESMLKPELYSEQNIMGGLGLLEEMAASPSKNLIFSSSAAVYGDPKYLPLDEKHPTLPINYYGYTKLCFEENLKWFSQLKGIHYVALRYFNAAGYHMEGAITGLERNPANLIPAVMEATAGLRDKILVFGSDYPTPDGTGTRDYIHVQDLALAHLQALQYLQKGGDSTSVNLGMGRHHSVFDIIKMTEKITGRKVPYEIVERRPGDAAEMYADYTLAQKLLAWDPQHSSLEQIISSTWKAYQHKA